MSYRGYCIPATAAMVILAACAGVPNKHDTAMAHVRLGSIAYRQGDTRTAREQFEHAARLEPNNSRTQYNLAMLNLNEARQHLRDYMATAREAPNRERVLTLLAELDEFASK